MGNEMISFGNAQLPSVQSLAESLRGARLSDSSGGVALLKMDKTGHWVFGAEATDIEEDSRWAINPFSFVHGFIAWGEGTPLDEVMASVSDPLPEHGPAPEGAKRGWERQAGMSLRCMNGEDEGLDVRYTTTSVGGKRAVQDIAIAIAEQVEKDPARPVPVVELGTSHYAHKTYGKIFTPIFKVVGWLSMEGEGAVADAGDEPEPEVQTRRRRRAAA